MSTIENVQSLLCRRTASNASVWRAGRACAATRLRARRGSRAGRASVTTGPRVAPPGSSTRASVAPATEGACASCRWTVAPPAVRACRYRPSSTTHVHVLCLDRCMYECVPQECSETAAGVWLCAESACAASPCHNGTCSSVDAAHYRCSCPPGITGQSLFFISIDSSYHVCWSVLYSFTLEINSIREQGRYSVVYSPRSGSPRVHFTDRILLSGDGHPSH